MSQPHWDLLLIHATLATFTGDAPYGLLPNAALACVDAVTVFDEDTPLETIEAVRPHVLVKGADYKPEQVIGREVVEANGGRVALVPLLPQKSTSALVDRIKGLTKG